MTIDKLCMMEDKSCGGCCCIEIPEETREELAEKFRFRRDAYKAHLAGRGNIAAYEGQISAKERMLSIDTLKETQEKKCHYLGSLNDKETKIGCLAHPEMNGGVDLRDNSFYKSAETCGGSFFCTAAEIFGSFTSERQHSFKHALSGMGWYDMSNQDLLYKKITDFARQSE